MRALNEIELEAVKTKFPAIADFGIGVIWLNDDGSNHFYSSYEIPKNCGYDEDLAKLEKYVTENFKI